MTNQYCEPTGKVRNWSKSIDLTKTQNLFCKADGLKMNLNKTANLRLLNQEVDDKGSLSTNAVLVSIRTLGHVTDKVIGKIKQSRENQVKSS